MKQIRLHNSLLVPTADNCYQVERVRRVNDMKKVIAHACSLNNDVPMIIFNFSTSNNPNAINIRYEGNYARSHDLRYLYVFNKAFKVMAKGGQDEVFVSDRAYSDSVTLRSMAGNFEITEGKVTYIETSNSPNPMNVIGFGRQANNSTYPIWVDKLLSPNKGTQAETANIEMPVPTEAPYASPLTQRAGNPTPTLAANPKPEPVEPTPTPIVEAPKPEPVKVPVPVPVAKPKAKAPVFTEPITPPVVIPPKPVAVQQPPPATPSKPAPVPVAIPKLSLTPEQSKAVKVFEYGGLSGVRFETDFRQVANVGKFQDFDILWFTKAIDQEVRDKFVESGYKTFIGLDDFRGIFLVRRHRLSSVDSKGEETLLTTQPIKPGIKMPTVFSGMRVVK